MGRSAADDPQVRSCACCHHALTSSSPNRHASPGTCALGIVLAPTALHMPTQSSKLYTASECAHAPQVHRTPDRLIIPESLRFRTVAAQASFLPSCGPVAVANALARSPVQLTGVFFAHDQARPAQRIFPRAGSPPSLAPTGVAGFLSPPRRVSQSRQVPQRSVIHPTRICLPPPLRAHLGACADSTSRTVPIAHSSQRQASEAARHCPRAAAQL